MLQMGHFSPLVARQDDDNIITDIQSRSKVYDHLKNAKNHGWILTRFQVELQQPTRRNGSETCFEPAPSFIHKIVLFYS